MKEVYLYQLDTTQKLMSASRDQVARNPLANDAILKILKGGNSQTFSVAKDAIKQQVLMVTIQEALEELGDAEAIAQQAFEHSGREHAVLADARAALVQRLLAETAHRSHQALADVETVAQQARDYLDAVPEAVQHGSAVLKARLIEEIAAQSIAALADAEVTAETARAQLSDNEDTLVRGTDALVAKLLGDIAARSADELVDAENTAAKARKYLDDEPLPVVQAQRALHARLLFEIGERATDELADVEAAADLARRGLGDNPLQVVQAQDTLVASLVAEIADRASSDLASPEAASTQARRLLGEEPETVTRAQAALTEALLHDISTRSTEALADASTAADRARACLSDEPAPVRNAGNVLKEKLLEEVAQRAAADLLDAENSARQARSYLSEDPQAVLGGSEALKTSLLHEIARRSTEALSDTQASAREAMHYVSHDHKVILQVVDELRHHLLESIVNESIKKINADVAQAMTGSVELLGDLEGVLESGGNGAENGAASSHSDALPNHPATGREEEEAAPQGDASSAAVEAPGSAPPAEQSMAGNGYRVNEIALPDAIVHNQRQLVDDAVTLGKDVALSELAEENPTGTVYYVYGIVSNKSEFPTNALPAAGLAPTHAPFLFPYQSVAALVSEVPMSEHTLQQVQDPEWKAESARQHERVLEQIMSEGHTILPLRFGTVFAAKHLLLRMLAIHYDAYESALETLQGKQEWSVKIYCDPEKLRQVISDSEKKVDDFVDGFVDLMNTQIEKGVGIDIDDELEAIRSGIDIEPRDLIENVFLNCEQYAYHALQCLASDSILNPPSDDNVIGDIRMILHAAFLVLEEEGDVFVETLQALTREHESLGFSYFVGGPHPPCHFAYRALAQAMPGRQAA